MRKITQKQLDVLIALAKFKFLNTQQLQNILQGDAVHLYRKLVEIRVKVINDKGSKNKGLIDRHTYGFNPGYGKGRDVYFLTKHGVNFLIENGILEENEIRYPKGRNTQLPIRSIQHRTSVINLHIAIDKWVKEFEGDILHVSADFDQIGSQRQGTMQVINKINISPDRAYIPDLITHTNLNDSEYLFAWEQHNGKDTKKLLRQIENHIEGLKNKLVGQKLGVNKLHRVGVIFEYESIMMATISRLMEKYGDNSNLHQCFIFKTNEAITSNFSKQWLLWNKKTTEIIGKG